MHTRQKHDVGHLDLAKDFPSYHIGFAIGIFTEIRSNNKRQLGLAYGGTVDLARDGV